MSPVALVGTYFEKYDVDLSKSTWECERIDPTLDLRRRGVVRRERLHLHDGRRHHVSDGRAQFIRHLLQ